MHVSRLLLGFFQVTCDLAGLCPGTQRWLVPEADSVWQGYPAPRVVRAQAKATSIT